MIYFTVRKDAEFVKQFKTRVEAYYALREDAKIPPNSATIIRRHSEEPMLKRALGDHWATYADLRASVAKARTRLHRIALHVGATVKVTHVPKGGAEFTFFVFDALLHDPTQGEITKQFIFDAINELIGAAEDKRDQEFKQLINPLYWIKSAFVRFLRLPLTILRLAGFDTSKFQDHFWPKAMQIIWLIFNSPASHWIPTN